MDKNNVHLGDGIADEVKSTINKESADLLTGLVKIVFDYLKSKSADIPKTMERILDGPEAKQDIATLWSEQLFEKGLVPKGYRGLPDNLLIANFRQDGYLGGLYAGYVLAMMALADNDASEDLVLAVRDYIRPNLLGHHYNNRDEFLGQYSDEKYSWIEKAIRNESK